LIRRPQVEARGGPARVGQIALLEKRGSGVCMAGGARFEEGLEGQAWGHGEKDGGFTLQSGLQNASEPKRGLC
jgi:hypothetical protein